MLSTTYKRNGMRSIRDAVKNKNKCKENGKSASPKQERVCKICSYFEKKKLSFFSAPLRRENTESGNTAAGTKKSKVHRRI